MPNLDSANGFNVMNSANGFTLLEILVSISILGVVLISIFKMQSGTIALSSSGEFYSTASYLASMKLTDFTDQLKSNNHEEDSYGDFGENFPGYMWHSHIEEKGLSSDSIPEETMEILETAIGKDMIRRFMKIDLEISHENGNTFAISTWRFLQNEEK
ncbi:type IV pilus modification PilV family protein [Desulfamplus magnetovallimortis]|uniref:type IV pilus modification PilV family protein n=1 Tax=Desulfamplus magnetovallimortis TaxID=1246637 RepID=UPI001645E348|nr:prepilin-type N-terminal cleavage/methylation domain-containing protein [Desulfamplus magnetovallimortis]